MKRILDSNVFFSAIIRNSTTRKIILESSEKLLLPYFVFIELQNHKEEILKKSRMNEQELHEVIQNLLTKMEIISREDSLKHIHEALNIVKNIDLDDLPYFACALLYEDSVIWSDDKALKKQNIVKVLNTKEIIKILERV
jgi:predicted nucleic acid-binding protein